MFAFSPQQRHLKCAIYRGPGGAGDATADATNAASVAEGFADAAGVSAAAAAVSASAASDAETAAEAAQAAAEAAQTAAETAETNAETAETNAETALASVQSLVDSLNTADIATLVPISADISAVALITSDISAVATVSTSDLAAIASVTSDIQSLAPVASDITHIAALTTDQLVALSSATSDMASLAPITTDISAVALVTTQVQALGTLGTVQLAALNTADIATLAPIAADITAVAAIDTDVTAVATLSTTDLSTVATNVTDITNFADVYQGAKASDPATRNDTTALQAGDLYFNTTDDAMKVYDGAAWVVAYVSGDGFLAASNNLSDLTNAATARQNLDLEIGVDVQAYDADTAKTDVAQSFTAQQTFTEVKDTVHTITDGAGFEIDPANGSIQVVTLGASRTPAATNFEAGQVVLLGIDDGTDYTITWSTVNPTWVKVGGTAVAPTLAATGFTWILLWKVSTTLYATEVGSP